nr:MAG TPA: ICP27, Herpes Simplex virus-1, viral.92A [Caudoviricetes sp.]
MLTPHDLIFSAPYSVLSILLRKLCNFVTCNFSSIFH